VLAVNGEPITADHLSPGLRAVKVSNGATADPGVALTLGGEDDASASPGRASLEPNTRVATSLQDARAAFEARFISQVLSEHYGNVSHAAVALGVSRVALQKKMKRYRLR
jgi:DNA-binding NtrC family response regulator